MAGPNRTTILLGLAIALGVLGDTLFHDAGWGLNVPLWIGALVAAGWWLSRHERPPLPWPLALVVFFAACAAWRASPFLRFWNLAALLAAGVLVSVHLRHRLAGARLSHYVRGAWAAALDVVTGPVQAAINLDWSWAADSPRRRTAVALGVGTALAVPVLLVFGALLASADPVVEAFVARLVHWDISTLVEHMALVGVLGWLAAGSLWGLAVARSRDVGGTPAAADDSPPARLSRRLGILELGIPLGVLLAMLVSFVGLQTRYLFGGESVIELTGMTYAEFARRGFFELVAVSALVVPVLLVCQHLLDRSRRPTVESFRALVVALLIVVSLVMLSALARMRLYVQSYGLTEDRLYASAFMGWVGFVLVWLAVTEVRDRLSRFATGAVLAGFGVMAALNLVNPDGLIARTNLARAARGLELDVAYLNRLSPDAMPAVAARWESLDATARDSLRAGLMSGLPAGDWRAMTWSRLSAERALDGLEQGARAIGGRVPRPGDRAGDSRPIAVRPGSMARTQVRRSLGGIHQQARGQAALARRILRDGPPAPAFQTLGVQRHSEPSAVRRGGTIGATRHIAVAAIPVHPRWAGQRAPAPGGMLSSPTYPGGTP